MSSSPRRATDWTTDVYPMKRPEQTTLIIDGDPFRYRVGFAAETPVFEIVAEFNGSMFRLRFKRTTKKTALENFEAYKATNPAVEIVDCVKTIEAEPEAHVRQMLRMQVDSVIKEVRKRYEIDRRDLRVDIYLSEGGNYRDKLATLKKYKGNRDALHKPVHYGTVGDELRGRYKVISATGFEADDAVSIAAHTMRKDGQRYIVASIDKDLDQIPGTHYDYMKKVFYEVGEEDARRWFWQQVLSGDATDNIGGACKIGPKRAETLVDLWETDWLVHGKESYEVEMWRHVVNYYGKQRSVASCYYAESVRSDHCVALENARLVYLQREPGELWVPPGEKKQFMKLDGDDLAS